MAHNYTLQVTAGTSYDQKTHAVIPVNQPTPTHLSSSLISGSLNVRVAKYTGLPRSSPLTSPYFSLPPHAKSGDQYSISFSFRLTSSISGEDLVFGNDFDHPIRDRLPPGFGTAFKIVKWVVDPGLEGDFYADKPFLYGGLGGSVNSLFVGDLGGKGGGKVGGEEVEGEEDAGPIILEGGSEEGMEVRAEKGIPDSEAGRKKFFLNETNKKGWTWEAGREYGCDFYNPYLDFNDFALKLPGFTLPIMKYWDGQGLRYTLKNKKTDEVLFVVLFTLYLKEDVDEEGNVREGVREEAGVPFELRKDGKRYGGVGEGEGEEGKEEDVVVGGNGDDDVD